MAETRLVPKPADAHVPAGAAASRDQGISREEHPKETRRLTRKVSPVKSRRSGLSLVSAGLCAAHYILLTDPRYGLHHPTGDNVIDAANQAQIGTFVGVAASLIM